MVFWILLVLLSLATLLALVLGWSDDGPVGSFMFGLITAVIGGMIVAAILGLFHIIPSLNTRTDTYSLRALATSSSTDGHFYFLGGGYIDGHRTLNYVKVADGGNYVSQARADQSVIYEKDSENPQVIETTWYYDNPWVMPFVYDWGHTYEFTIPTDSILSDYTIDNG